MLKKKIFLSILQKNSGVIGPKEPLCFLSWLLYLVILWFSILFYIIFDYNWIPFISLEFFEFFLSFRIFNFLDIFYLQIPNFFAFIKFT